MSKSYWPNILYMHVLYKFYGFQWNKIIEKIWWCFLTAIKNRLYNVWNFGLNFFFDFSISYNNKTIEYKDNFHYSCDK